MVGHTEMQRINGIRIRKILAFIPCMLCMWPSIASSFPFVYRSKRWNPSASKQASRQVVNCRTSVLPIELVVQQTMPSEKRLLIHWKGEGVEGYSLQFRHVEFRGSLQAILGPKQMWIKSLDSIRFENALNYTGHELTTDLKISGYNQAMQYLIFPSELPVTLCVQAAERCSLIHSLYEIVAEASSEFGYEALSDIAVENEAFRDMWRDLDGPNSAQTWCVRVRHYGSKNDTAKERRYGARARSLTMEREALLALTPILSKLGGKVNLAQPDCKIYVFDGLRRERCGTVNLLARRLAKGARTSSINPNTRICVTNTPLCPVAAFIMCNTAQIREHSTVLDPFCGSAATLLATAMLSPSSSTVGIEIAHNGIVNRADISKDFVTRGLTEPVALILGDSSNRETRVLAREAINGQPFDCIVTDPPYGIRESTGVLERRPIDELLQMIAEDREAKTPLLRQGGRLVVFLPQQTEKEELADILPTSAQIHAAGLRFDLTREQPLNDILSRWLVSFVCE